MLKVQHLGKSFQNNNGLKKILNDISFEVGPKEFVAMYGPNGCGKTTILNIIANLIPYDSGEIIFEDKREAPRVGYVWQNYNDSLMPWLSVAENIGLPLKFKGIRKEERLKRVNQLMDRFNIPFKSEDSVYALSGGQKQIVSILRNLTIEPDIMLLDEPFSALDYQMSLVVRKQILDIWDKTDFPILFVSHDIDDAIFLADKIMLLTSPPTTIWKIIENKIQRPRDYSVMSTPEYLSIKQAVVKFIELYA